MSARGCCWDRDRSRTNVIVRKIEVLAHVHFSRQWRDSEPVASFLKGQGTDTGTELSLTFVKNSYICWHLMTHCTVCISFITLPYVVLLFSDPFKLYLFTFKVHCCSKLRSSLSVALLGLRLTTKSHSKWPADYLENTRLPINRWLC